MTTTIRPDEKYIPTTDQLAELWKNHMPMNGMERIECTVGFDTWYNELIESVAQSTAQKTIEQLRENRSAAADTLIRR